MNSLLYSDSPGGKKSLGHNFIDGNNGCLMISCGSHFPNFHMHEVETRIHTEITRVNLVGGGTTFLCFDVKFRAVYSSVCSSVCCICVGILTSI